MRKTDTQQLESIRIVGGLISTPVLQAIRHYELDGQQIGDYGVEKGLKLNDELSRYWRIAQSRWNEYQRERLRDDANQNRLARDEWLLPLLEKVLGYQVTKCQPIALGKRVFPITHVAHRGAVPLVLCGAQFDLDKGDVTFGHEGRKRSPAGLAQEYLNAEDDCLWAIVSNGTHLRVLRDNPAITRPAFIEIDFARMFEEDNYADFATFWLLLQASRSEPRAGQIHNCWLEVWRNKGLDEGERALENLRYGVADALRILGSGFVIHPANQSLRDKISSGELSLDNYFQQILRLVYRFLFLFTAEDRDIALLPMEFEGHNYKAARDLYTKGYSLTNLRDRSRLKRHHDHYNDAWQLLLVTFHGFAEGQLRLAQPALGGLFAKEQCADLETLQLDNKTLFGALLKLAYFEQQKTLTRINYRDMDTEEFGSVYESLLELIPQLSMEGQWQFSFLGDASDEEVASGHSRKLTGSYYTPDSLVQELIKSALEPVIADRLDANVGDPRTAILSISVCDPACGSGHFLLAAARRLAAELAQIEAGSDQPAEADYRHALREVVSHCIYGVDLNPLALELCRTALWLEALEPGKPLGFLDAHIQCGNSLVGVLDPSLLENGIPDKAFDALTGDDKDTCRSLKAASRQAGKDIAVAMRMQALDLDSVESMPEDNLDQIKAKQEAWLKAQKSDALQKARLKEDLFTAAFFATKTEETANRCPTNAHLRQVVGGGALEPEVSKFIQQLAHENRFFHWQLAFPQVFGDGDKSGFDVILGNPPWERIKLQEQEFFSSRSLEIANAPNAAARTKLIKKLSDGSPVEQKLFEDFQRAKKAAESTSQFARTSERFPLTGKGDVNLYALFSEHFAKCINSAGQAGLIVPTGIATDDSTKAFFGWLTIENHLVSLFDFENREALFDGVHRSYKFCLLTIGNNVPQAELQFFNTRVAHLADEDRRFTLSADDFALINPNTLTCPVFRSKKDAELTKKLYRAAPVLIREARVENGRQVPAQNPWGVKFTRLFDMSNDSPLFHTYQQMQERDANVDYSASQSREDEFLPLYEAKMVHHYDHRWATYETDGETSRDCTLEEKQDPNYQPLPRYWVDRWEVTLRTAQAPSDVIKACKKVDTEALLEALKQWAAGQARRNRQESLVNEILQPPSHSATGVRDAVTDDWFADETTGLAGDAELNADQYPLESDELEDLVQLLRAQEADNLWDWVKTALEIRCPKYLLGWRDICRSTDERTVIAGIVPLSAVGNSFPLAHLGLEIDARKIAAFVGSLVSLTFDFVARHKVGGTHLNFFIIRQLPVLSPDQYKEGHLDFISPRVVELTFTAKDLKVFSEENGVSCDPFAFNPLRRHQLKCELDAYYAKLYGLSRNELRYILDPSDIMGVDYPSETFRGLKNKELKEFGEYRTQRLVLEAWDKLESGELH
ncbi:MAG: N-6 DNA methylase [Gammaproteobacteria bacterium]